MKTFHEPQFVVLQVYEFQTEGNSDKTFVEAQFRFMSAYELHKKGNSSSDIF